jgi:NADH dehydrogenase [ubiquinone] 1 alpha subcomplex assembly factor 1
MLRHVLLGLLLMGQAPLLAADGPRNLFAFDSPDVAKQWQTVNDGVMGGRSDGRFVSSDNETLEFFGTLSLRNNGGFASVRSKRTKLGLTPNDEIIARVRGDGRKYTLNLHTPGRRTAFSYRAEFETVKGEWVEIRFRLQDFVATSFGRVLRGQTLDPRQVDGLGILLGDKKAGSFKLEVDWVKAVSAEDANQ